MKKRYLLAACAAVFATPAFGDACTTLVNHTMCLKFVYSVGSTNTYTAHFAPGGVFTLPGTGSSGTYTCKGKSFVEVNYLFGGFETQQWYARGAAAGTKLGGFGKSITNDYLYKISTARVGACPATAPTGAPVNRSSQKDL